jgi:hypothetical protein
MTPKINLQVESAYSTTLYTLLRFLESSQVDPLQIDLFLDDECSSLRQMIMQTW